MSNDLAIVSGVGVWKRADGGELRRFGLTYTLGRQGPSCKMVVATIHDPDAALAARVLAKIRRLSETSDGAFPDCGPIVARGQQR